MVGGGGQEASGVAGPPSVGLCFLTVGRGQLWVPEPLGLMTISSFPVTVTTLLQDVISSCLTGVSQVYCVQDSPREHTIVQISHPEDRSTE